MMKNIPHKICLALLGFLALFGLSCSDGDKNGADGELGRGAFFYQCADTSADTICRGTDTQPPFPDAIAVNAQFGMIFKRKGDDSNNYERVMGGSASHIVQTDGQFTALQPVDIALLAATSGNKAIDLLHIHPLPVEAVSVTQNVWSNDLSDTDIGDTMFFENQFTIEVGASKTLRAVVFDHRRRILAGVLPHQWSVSNPSVVNLDDDATQSVVTIIGETLGTTQLTVSVSGVTSSVTVTVVPNENSLDGGINADTDIDTDINDTAQNNDAGNNVFQATNISNENPKIRESMGSLI